MHDPGWSCQRRMPACRVWLCHMLLAPLGARRVHSKTPPPASAVLLYRRATGAAGTTRASACRCRRLPKATRPLAWPRASACRWAGSACGRRCRHCLPVRGVGGWAGRSRGIVPALPRLGTTGTAHTWAQWCWRQTGLALLAHDQKRSSSASLIVTCDAFLVTQAPTSQSPRCWWSLKWTASTFSMTASRWVTFMP